MGEAGAPTHELPQANPVLGGVHNLQRTHMRLCVLCVCALISGHPSPACPAPGPAHHCHEQHLHHGQHPRFSTVHA